MQELDEILIKYISDNIKADTPKTIGQIFEHFSKEGYSKEEITNLSNAGASKIAQMIVEQARKQGLI